jgi:lipoprotein NlpI
MPTVVRGLYVLLFVVAVTPLVNAQNDVEKTLSEALAAAKKGPSEQAVELLTQALSAKPDLAAGYYLRGRENFRLGRIKESRSDFDKYVELRPQLESQQWERGITYFYAGDFAKGAKQFELYQTFHDQDVENSVWRYLCMVPDEGIEKAQKTMLPIARDPRVPMMTIYDLYRGKAKPEDILEAVKEGDVPADVRASREFYAHLYLGLWYDAAGEKAKAREHIFLAEKRPIGHYMYDVARVHAERLRTQKDEK